MGEMQYRRVGDSGLAVSVVGLGCNSFGSRIDADRSRQVVEAALDAGITLFDTADVYGAGRSEELLGRALGAHRDDVVVATKFGISMRGANGRDHGARGSRTYVRRAVEASLRRLGTDRIDLYQMHAPDPLTPVEETLDVLTDLVREGKIRYAGSSKFAAWQVVDADWSARTSGSVRMVGTQANYNLLERHAEDELVPACEAAGVGLLPFFPLARGLLTGRYARDETPPPGSKLALSPEYHRRADFDRIELLQKYARDRGVTILDVAVAGLAEQPAVASVVAGATDPEQVRANAAALAWRPDAADLAVLDELTLDESDHY